MDKNRIIYSISVKDVHTVAKKNLNRNATKEEVKFIEDHIGDHISWYDIIEYILKDFNIELQQKKKFQEK